MGLRTHTEELRVPEIIIKLISTFLYRCTSSSRSYSGWVLTFIKMISLKRAISGLSNAVPTIPSWFLDAKIYSYEFWTFFHEIFMDDHSKIIVQKIYKILEFRNSITFDLFIVCPSSTRHMETSHKNPPLKRPKTGPERFFT